MVVKQRLYLLITGAVQGVGFRPFIYKLAHSCNLLGWVHNSSKGVEIEVEGEKPQLELFLEKLATDKPPRAQIYHIENHWLEAVGYSDFQIRSSAGGPKTAVVLPDLATCADCLAEIFDPTNRRYRYPFTNCTNCGPRYSIIRALPYDRQHTSMAAFAMCADCQQEYQDPLNRRFHAQPNACPSCGPQVSLWDKQGQVIAQNYNSIVEAAREILRGKIIALKGLGGFQLLVDATNQVAVARLRQLKQRPAKPLAVLYPSLAWVERECLVAELERELLLSPEAPIVLLKQLYPNSLAPNVAPANPYLGVMLPYTPLHHLLCQELGIPVVATSGNLSDEPICIDEQESLQRLGNLADFWLVHNRPIVRPLDDSVVRVIGNQPVVLRRARGYAPLPITLNLDFPLPEVKVMATGAHWKNTVAIAWEKQVILSQHLGDLQTQPALENFQEAIASLEQLYEFQPNLIACDRHPDYFSTHYASTFNLPICRVQHHYAHILAVMAEYQLLEETVLGVSWDGTGYGLDGTIWGGEFFLISQAWSRVKSLRPFPLVGGDKAIKEPRRSLLGLLFALWGESLFTDSQKSQWLTAAFTPSELKLLAQVLRQGINTSLTSSMGRLFDAVAALINGCFTVSFEGQAAMNLEFSILDYSPVDFYPFDLPEQEPIIDWEPLILEILRDWQNSLPVGFIAAKFHNTLSEIIVKIAQQVGVKSVILTGGCFQNAYLTYRTLTRLESEGFIPYYPSLIPPNDGSIALGQAIAAILSKKTR